MAKTILAVDDSRSILQMVSFTLKGAGYAVEEAGDGQAALTKAAAQKFDPDRPEYAGHGWDHSGAKAAQSSELQIYPDPDADHRGR